ncbi:hypothetical protein Bca52824_086335 [Brassica carinata]|uniref:Uncharacterized protein n=1 Tax=Brassica carinata TaxID=52824 RepID=A0A8X7TLW7_BRACI|nr:hypothetical protein Bca52824_086335 [Brassica carinata]
MSECHDMDFRGNRASSQWKRKRNTEWLNRGLNQTNLVQEGQELFQSMRTRFGATQVIQHYGCIVDLLDKVGRLQEAIYGDTVMGEEIGKALLEMEGEQKKLGFECEDYVAFIKCEGKWVEVEKNHTKLILVVCKFNS